MFRNVACAISGGVDSAVALHLLAKHGLNVTGVYMNNWDRSDESGKCSSNQDMVDAKKVCDTLGVRFISVDFVKQYWLNVFHYLLDSYQKGFTPNPDIVCNKRIKFGTFHDYAMNSGFSAIATGHYARSSYGDILEKYDSSKNAKLLKPADDMKDQTFFLSGISQAALRKTMFPLSGFLKPQVRKIASEIGLEWLNEKRESTGICMIGERNFANFIQEYIAESPGKIIDVDSGRVVGEHKGIHYFTIGQHIRLANQEHKHFVTRFSPEDKIVYVASSSYHPALYGNRMTVSNPSWVAGSPPEDLQKMNNLMCDFKFQHVLRSIRCRLEECANPKDLRVTLDLPTRALCLGQFAVFYQEDECLGCAEITAVDPLW